MDLAKIEDKRSSLQEEIDNRKAGDERNEQGQYATPFELSSELMAFARTLLPSTVEAVDFIEPGAGTGAFLSGLFATFSEDEINRALGIEKDFSYARPAQELWGKLGVEIKQSDFTESNPPVSEEDRFDLLVTNPPYVRHHHLSKSKKNSLIKKSAEILGKKPSGYTGLYCYFIYLAHNWLRSGGVAGWLVPAEFMEVGYGDYLKRYLLEEVTLLRIHRYMEKDLQFDDALVSSCVVWYRKERPSPNHTVELTFGGTHTAPERRIEEPTTVLRSLRKWNLLSFESTNTHDHITISDAFRTKRGLATGKNSYFILEKSEAAKYNLPDQFLTPILPSPRYLKNPIIEAENDGSPAIDKKLVLIDCDVQQKEVRANYPTLWAYLEKGKAEGVHEGYLCRNRKVWYYQEKRPPAPFLCQYMSRKDLKSGNPFNFYLNRSEATASNNIILLYPRSFLRKAIQEHSELAEKILALLSNISGEVLRQNGRVYGGGLHKFEPRELGDLPVPGLRELLEEYSELPLYSEDAPTLFQQTQVVNESTGIGSRSPEEV